MSRGSERTASDSWTPGSATVTSSSSSSSPDHSHSSSPSTCMDLDPGRLDDYARWSSHAAAAVGSHMDAERWEQTQRSIVDMQQYFATEMHDRAARPRADDLLTAIATAQIPDLDGQLWPIELPVALSICQQLFVGGIETTTKLLTEALLLLTRHPDQYQRLRDDPSRIPAVVEEALRVSTPAQGLYRLVTQDVDLEGVHIPAGSKVVVVYAAANRDPAQFDTPRRLRPRPLRSQRPPRLRPRRPLLPRRRTRPPRSTHRPRRPHTTHRTMDPRRRPTPWSTNRASSSAG